MFSKGLLTASDEYLRLKHHHGHWHNHDHHPAIDNHGGERHRAMVELQKHLGNPGTTTHDIEHLMGPPTKILHQPDEVLLSELKRNNETYTFPHHAEIWIYEWRSNHDYVYFIISNDKKVIQSAWYYAFE
ncbi:unnamed protein product [Rotaria magnacalcarata]|uniref:Uncharacterized protein n=2 Tax=Rotaria magnacalcarata TaxID=392030 RepID=A0A816H8B6_9BILA|nr:unnamed protein product [Rotaria magnacalcarata]CAF1684388.1 unnamed protein product [Rotaria magnacalcarata]CAF2072710.1 unnamed protein product [Rotaria magnacalcarata]CAF2073256.1 unnamed protein product [Rotaria magnacalcarata]CAF2099105.1 unnamed protein product [Rotaria magnacalcarata]